MGKLAMMRASFWFCHMEFIKGGASESGKAHATIFRIIVA